MPEVKKIVLAYSGGLDTSIILRWLQETYDAEVITFTATDQTPTEPSGVEVFLNWATQNATTVTIDNGLGPRPMNGSVPLRVTTTTTFTIVASNQFSEDTKQVTVTVP